MYLTLTLKNIPKLSRHLNQNWMSFLVTKSSIITNFEWRLISDVKVIACKHGFPLCSMAVCFCRLWPWTSAWSVLLDLNMDVLTESQVLCTYFYVWTGHQITRIISNPLWLPHQWTVSALFSLDLDVPREFTERFNITLKNNSFSNKHQPYAYLSLNNRYMSSRSKRFTRIQYRF